jgi:hypothetical protein
MYYIYITFICEGPRGRCYGRNAALRLIVQPCDEDEEKYDQFFSFFPSNGAPVEWNCQGRTEVLGGKPVPVPLCPPQIPHGLTPGSNPGLRGDRPATNRLSHGTALYILHIWSYTICHTSLVPESIYCTYESFIERPSTPQISHSKDSESSITFILFDYLLNIRINARNKNCRF